MSPFQRENNRRGGRDFGGRDSGNRVSHTATCSSCGDKCEVPFKPSGDKPVYCRDCFKRDDSRGPRRDGPRGGGRFESKGPNVKRELDEINEKLNRILIALGEKP
jgi:CxxC-x17-CxxC domain-containing protein